MVTHCQKDYPHCVWVFKPTPGPTQTESMNGQNRDAMEVNKYSAPYYYYWPIKQDNMSLSGYSKDAMDKIGIRWKLIL